MEKAFDPIHTWLGVPPNEQPADYYRLLGIERFESSFDVIQSAADRQMTYVRSFQGGPRGIYTQPILNQLSAARLCLMNADSKAAYDQELRMQPGHGPVPVHMTGPAAPPAAAPPPPPPSSGGPPPPQAEPDAQPPVFQHSVDRFYERTSRNWMAPVLAVILLGIIATMLTYLVLRQRELVEGDGDGGNTTAGTSQVESPATEPEESETEPVEEELVIEQEADESIHLMPITAQRGGPVSFYESGAKSWLGNWTGDNSATWKFRVIRVVRPGIFRCDIKYTKSGAEATAELAVDGQRRATLDLLTSADQTRTATKFLPLNRSGVHTLTLRVPSGSDATLNVHQVRLTPTK